MSLIEKAVSRQRTADAEQSLHDHGRRSPVARPSAADLDTVKAIALDPKHAFEQRLTTSRQDESVGAAYKMLRTRAAQRARANGWNSIAVTAMRAGEGKSTTSINLALSLAAQPDQRVFLVDLDFHNHAVVKYLGLSGHAHLMDVVRGEMGLTAALVQIEGNGLYCLLNEERIEDSSELLMSSSMNELAQVFKSLGGTVIYDLPPLLEADDFLAFSRHTDCALVVVSEGQTTREDMRLAAERLEQSNLLGIVLNKSRGAVPRYY